MAREENRMGTGRIFPLLMTMAIPPMISMMIQSMYNIVDSIFVARLGESALTAVSLAFPLQNLILAVAVGLGVGVNACIARSLGARNRWEVTQAAAHGLVFTGIHALVFIVAGLFLIRPFLQMFTEDPQVLEWACSYTRIVVFLSFGTLFHITIEKMFQASGNMVVPMILQGVGALINIILDPILIFGLLGFPAMGVTGAAIATVTGQISACGLAVLLFWKKNRAIHLDFHGFRLDRAMTAKIYGIAVPSGIMMALPSVLVGILNGMLAGISQTAVAVFGLYFKLQTFVYMPASGLIQGMRPIISYNFGAELFARMHRTRQLSVLIAATIMAVGTVLFLAVPQSIMSLFSATEEMVALGVPALRIISLGFLVSSIGIIYAGMFEALGKGLYSLCITLTRQLVVIVVLAFLLKGIFGITGIWMTFPIAELLASLLALFFWKKEKRDLQKEGYAAE